MKLELRGDSEIVADFKEAPLSVSLAMIRAMNRGIASARTVVTQGIASDTGLLQKDVREAVSLQQASLDRPVARIAASLKRIPLIKFKARGPEPTKGKGRGVTYSLKGGGGRLSNAFIATMSSGHRGVFARSSGGSGKKSRGAWSANLPIIERYGPSLGHVFVKFKQAAMDRALEMYDTTLAHELERRAPATVTVHEVNTALGGGA